MGNGLELYGREWKKVAENIPTRSSAQIRSHAQKYFSKMTKHNTIQATTTATAHAAGQAIGSHGIASSHNNDDRDVNSIRRSTLSSSALEKVAHIISNPSTVQKEVETTLKSLHERYSQLQRMIELRNSRQKLQEQQLVVVEEEEPVLSRGPASAALELQEERTFVTANDNNTTSSLFGSEELIALHVLRTSLKNPELKKCSYSAISSEDEEEEDESTTC